MMNCKEMKNARAALIDSHMFSGNVTPAGTVAHLVEEIGHQAAAEIVALCVIAKGEWDARISEESRAWAFELTGTTCGTLAAQYFYYPDEIHPCHMEQIASAMMNYAGSPALDDTQQRAALEVEPEEEPAGPQITESRIMDADDLRALCIEKEWYTYGNNAEYDRLFQRLDNPDGTRAEMTSAKLYEIAEDIRRASDWRWTTPAIMYELVRICRSFFDIV